MKFLVYDTKYYRNLNKYFNKSILEQSVIKINEIFVRFRKLYVRHK